MFYTVYKITNLLDGKYYIAKHQTENLDDGYMGSGKLITRAIKKHGRENFKKEILFVFDTEEEMNAKEAEIVVVSEETYNLCDGGQGGFGYINSKRDFVEHNRKIAEIRNYKDPSYIEKLSLAVQATVPYRKKAVFTEESLKRRNCSFLGKKHTEETKDKIAKHNSQYTGIKNSQYGSMWITDGKQNKKISKESSIPSGWRKGRVLAG